MTNTRIIDFSDTEEASGQALPAGTELLGGKFKIDEQIGSGGFGVTYLAKDLYLDRDVVIKECFPEAFCCRFGTQVRVTSARYTAQHRKSVDMFMLEARSMAKLRHPNIVGVHQVFEENQTAYMVLDLIHGRDLLDIIEDESDPLSPEQIRDILVKTLDAIDLIHSNDLLHRDISPDNILLDKWGSPSLIDFGAAREHASEKSNDVTTMLMVKDGYSPHEFYIAGDQQQPCSDLYALGATIYHLISGEAPPNSQERVAALTNNDDDPYLPLAGRFTQHEHGFLEAVDKSLSVRPKDRIASAKGWLTLIETESKKVNTVKMPEARMTRKSLSELVQETNKHVLKAYDTPPSEPAEVVTSLPQQKSYRPAWVDEFNRETNEAELGKKGKSQSTAKPRRWAEFDCVAMAEQEEAERQLTTRTAERPRNIFDWVLMHRTA